MREQGKYHAATKTHRTTNEDMKDERQMLFVPAVYTKAVNKQTGLHLAPADGIVEITDTVIYETLPDNRTFLVEGSLRDAKTGEVLTNSDGEPAIVAKLLTTSKRAQGVSERNNAFVGPLSGEFDMPAFKINAAELEGKTVVVRKKPDALVYAIKDAQKAANYMDWKAGLISDIEYVKACNSIKEVPVREHSIQREDISNDLER